MSGKLSSLKNEHTLHIPIKNRPNWLKYILQNYIKFKYDGTILLVDDSNEENFEKNSSIVKNFQNLLNVNHLKYNFDTKEDSHKIFNKSKYLSISNIDTEFYSASCDDDFFNPEFAKLAIPFLRNNPSFSNVTGIDVKIFMNKNFDVYKKQYKYWPENIHDDPLDRAVNYFYNPNANYLGVNRVSEFDVLKQNETKTNSFFVRDESDYGLPVFDKEIPWAFLTNINGKSKIFKKVINTIRSEYISPDRDTTKHLFSTNKNENYGYINQILSGTFNKSFKRTYDEFLKLISDKSNYNKDIINDTLKKTLWAFICNQKFDYNLNNNLMYVKSKNEYKKNTIRKIINIPNLKVLLSRDFYKLISLIINQLKRKFEKILLCYYDRKTLKDYLKSHENLKSGLISEN